MPGQRLHPGRLERAVATLRRHGRPVSTSEAIRLGIHPRTLYAMRDAGVVQQLSRGLYRLASLPPLGHPDLVTVAAKAPRGVICLVSALAFHDLTTQVPHEVYLAIRRGSREPRLDYPPVRLFEFSSAAFEEGIETHQLDGVPVRIYSPEKTIAGGFKYRHKIGLDVALEALRLWRGRRGRDTDALVRYARICRVERVMRPYLEAVL